MRKLAAIALTLAFFVPIVSSQDRSAPTAQTQVYSPSDLAKQARAALAQTSGRIELAGLAKPVEVIRDTWGVAHIYAQTVEDAKLRQNSNHHDGGLVHGA